jgi:hypothetical protein
MYKGSTAQGSGLIVRHSEDDPGRECSAEQMIAELILLSDQGYCDGEMGDDADSRQFAEQVRRNNRDWTPGQIPVVSRKDSLLGPDLKTGQIARARQPIRTTPRARAPRSVRRRTHSAAASSGRSDDPSELPPPLGGSRAWAREVTGLDDDGLILVARCNNAVDRAVRDFRGRR